MHAGSPCIVFNPEERFVLGDFVHADAGGLEWQHRDDEFARCGEERDL